MAKAIVDTTFGEDLGNAQDQIFRDTALLDTDTLSSDEFQFGNTQGDLELKVKATSAHTLVAATTINVIAGSVSGGAKATVLASFVLPLGKVIAAGDDLVKFINPKENIETIYTQVDIVTLDDESPLTVDALIVQVS